MGGSTSPSPPVRRPGLAGQASPARSGFLPCRSRSEAGFSEAKCAGPNIGVFKNRSNSSELIFRSFLGSAVCLIAAQVSKFAEIGDTHRSFWKPSRNFQRATKRLDIATQVADV